LRSKNTDVEAGYRQHYQNGTSRLCRQTTLNMERRWRLNYFPHRRSPNWEFAEIAKIKIRKQAVAE
jgi:hypothetical protein